MVPGATETTDDPVVRVVWGCGTGPTPLASYDAALAAAGVENYNLTTVSSIVPAEATVEATGTAPDLGPAGNRLTVVEARAMTDADEAVATAGLAWAVGPGPGIFYEVAGTVDESECRRRLEAGLSAACDLREWTIETTDDRIVTSEAPDDGFGTAVALGVYGTSDPIV